MVKTRKCNLFHQGDDFMKKHTNKLISILLALAMLLTIVPMNLSVSATPDTDYTGYYKITNAGNLAWFACLVAGDTSQSGITEAVPDAKAVLTADIDITVLAERLGKSWVGIGTAEIPFTGVFDGNGYTIKGLTTDTDLTKSAVATVPVDTEKQGLFGVIGKGGVVRDVIVEGTANLSDTIKYGGICSENNGTIENVLSMVTVTGGDNADIFCHTNNGTITNSFTNQTTSVASGVTVVDADTLASGSVAYDLGVSFGQTIGTDTQPVHYDGTNRVYMDGDAYTNTAPVYAASVTDANGNELEGSPYKTFAEAVTAAEANENSTLTLLDNITLTSTQWISSGKFTLDLSDKTLLCESSVVLQIMSGADLTIKDSGKNGLIETKTTDGSAIWNRGGTLTFESGMVKSGEYAINNSGKLKVNNGIFEGKYSIYISSDSSTEINDGTFNGDVWGFSGYTINDGNFTSDYVGINCQGETLTINGGTFDIDEIKIFRGTVELKGGQFTRGFTLNDYEYDDDEPHYLNDILADGYYYRNAGGYLMTFNDDASVIDEPVHIRRGAKLVTQAEITLAQTEFEFTGEEIRPEVTVKIAGITLEDKDIIELVYNNNVNAGTGTVTVSSSDPYFEGEVTLEFTITPKVVDTIWSETTEFDYDGNAHSVTATYVDVNGETVNAVVANGTNTEVGRYTAVATIEDTNYVIKNETAKCQYIIKGDIDLTGAVVSFGDETDEVTLRLYKDGDEENAYVVTVTGNSAEYTFEGIANGTYILEVSKLNHVTRTYEVVVSEEDVTQDVKIHLRGDINGDGKLNVVDAARINAQAKGAVALIDYELACADVNGDGKVNVIDAAVSNAHAKGIKPIW